ncbi:hypothetical protein BKA61DRAFT_671210 [Leptodontidium sp. MPI-SDFR-AT-0119]|nr:hypothetical protein BKA61DRAFT_671210 [Leptodontidium sp. MPI-SDFR-AT-0119]
MAQETDPHLAMNRTLNNSTVDSAIISPVDTSFSAAGSLNSAPPASNITISIPPISTPPTTMAPPSISLTSTAPASNPSNLNLSPPTSPIATAPSIPTVADPETKTYTTFTCFPKLPLELRRKIFKAAAPPPGILHVQVAIDKDSCGNMDKHECQDITKDASNTVLKFLPHEKHTFAIMNINLECSNELRSLLPCRLPSADPSICIRFNPEDMQIFIRNAEDLLTLAEDLNLGFHRPTSGHGKLCTESYFGGKITTLMVHAKHIWGNNQDGGFEDYLWTSFFKHFFKDLDNFVAGYIDDDDINCLFPDENTSCYHISDDEDNFGSDSDDSVGTLEWKRERRDVASERCSSPPPDIIDPDALDKTIGDFLANVMDAIETEDPMHFGEAKRPVFYVHAGVNLCWDSGDLDRKLNLEELEIRDPAIRIGFETWDERWGLDHLN